MSWTSLAIQRHGLSSRAGADRIGDHEESGESVNSSAAEPGCLWLQQVLDAVLLLEQFLQGQVDALLAERIDLEAFDQLVVAA